VSGNSALGVLLAGFSGIGSQDHQSAMYEPALRAQDGCAIVGVVASSADDKAVAHAAAERLGVPCHDDLATALERPEVGAVSVAVPLAERRRTIITAARAGKHILADKPLAATLEDVLAVAEAVAEAGVALVPAHHQRLNPVLRAAAAAVGAGRVGLPWDIQADFVVAGGDPAPTGELFNLGLYPLDVVRSVIGLDAHRVHAIPIRSGRTSDDLADDGATLMVDYDNGVTATIVVMRAPRVGDLAPGGVLRHRYRISGSHGVLAVDALRLGLQVRTASRNDRGWTGQNTTAALIDSFHRAARGGTCAPGIADAVHVHRVLDAAQRSTRSGRPELIADSQGVSQ